VWLSSSICGSTANRSQRTEVASLADVELQTRIAGRMYVTVVPGSRCGACGEDYVRAPDLQRFELLTARTLADAGQSSGAAFKFMRKAMSPKATDLAVLLGVTAELRQNPRQPCATKVPKEGIERWEPARRARNQTGLSAPGVPQC
jgi:hypothetical protein